MPPRSTKVAAAASSNNSSELLKGFRELISSLHARFDLFRRNPIDDLRTVYSRPDLAEAYRSLVPNPMWLERMRDIDYTAALQEEVRSGRAQTQLDFAKLWDAAVGRLRADIMLIVANCTAFNRDAVDIMKITADFEKAALAECDVLQQAGATMCATGAGGGGGASDAMFTMAMPQSGGGKDVVKVGAAVSGGGKGKRRGRVDDGDDNVQAQQDEDLVLTQQLPATTKSATLKTVKKPPQQQPQPPQPQVVAPVVPVVVQEVLTPEQKVERIRHQFKQHEQVSGPLALKLPEPLRQRMMQQHAAFANSCHVPGLPIPTLQRSNSTSSTTTTPLTRGYDPAASEESDTVISVLRDFFISVCEKNRLVAAAAKNTSNSSKSDADTTVAAIIGNALRHNFDQSPCPYLPSYFGDLKQHQQQQQPTAVIFPTTHSKAPEKVKHCWNAITKVLLPFFNEAAFKCYLYSDERSALNWRSVQMALDQEKGAAPWHTVMHFDVLIRSLPDLPIAASAVLGESFKRAAANTMIPQSVPASAQSNFYGDAAVIVGRTVVPVLNELLQFICDVKLPM